MRDKNWLWRIAGDLFFDGLSFVPRCGRRCAGCVTAASGTAECKGGKAGARRDAKI